MEVSSSKLKEILARRSATQSVRAASAAPSAPSLSSPQKPTATSIPPSGDSVASPASSPPFPAGGGTANAVPGPPASLPEDEGDWKPETFQTLDFLDGAEVVNYFDPNFNKGGDNTLHPWQIEVNETLAHAKADSKHPFKFVLCAANGSGKDYLVIAPFVLWFLLSKRQSLVVITSASGTQLTAQTETYIRNLATKVNAFYKDLYGVEIMKIRQRYVKCLLSGSECRMFATDEEGRAEGYHPLEPGCAFAIIVNEAKSVAPEIFRALRRCTGYTHWINVSTPGLVPAGDFYKTWINWPNKRRVTVYDCPHHAMDEYEADKHDLGEHSALFRSKWLALFTTVDGDTVIPHGALERLRNKLQCKLVPHRCKHWPLRVGIDLAAGGDETVVTIFHGNKQIFLKGWRERDTTHTSQMIMDILHDNAIPMAHEHIYADDGGVGRAIIDVLRKAGYVNIKRVLNQSKAKNSKEFRNRGAELWYNFRRLVEDGVVILLDDDTLWSQLATRRNKKVEESTSIVKVQLESKAAAKAEGLPSPDRADATVLAFAGITLSSFYDSELDNDRKLVETGKNKLRFRTDAELEAHFENLAFEEAFGEKDRPKGKPIHGSLQAHIKQKLNYDRRTARYN